MTYPKQRKFVLNTNDDNLYEVIESTETEWICKPLPTSESMWMNQQTGEVETVTLPKDDKVIEAYDSIDRLFFEAVNRHHYTEDVMLQQFDCYDWQSLNMTSDQYPVQINPSTLYLFGGSSDEYEYLKTVVKITLPNGFCKIMPSMPIGMDVLDSYFSTNYIWLFGDIGNGERSVLKYAIMSGVWTIPFGDKKDFAEGYEYDEINLFTVSKYGITLCVEPNSQALFYPFKEKQEV